MPKISLTDLVDIISKAGGPKATKVSQIKNREEYQPATDFYKQFRAGVVAIHKSGGTRSDLARITDGLTEKNRVANYPAVIAGYKKWWGKKQLAWFQPPSEIFSRDGIDVSINPEIGLDVNGQRHVIKLYLKSDKLTKSRADLIVALMAHVLGPELPNTVIAVLDVRNAKLFIAGEAQSAHLLPMVDAELAYVAKLWPLV